MTLVSFLIEQFDRLVWVLGILIAMSLSLKTQGTLNDIAHRVEHRRQRKLLQRREALYQRALQTSLARGRDFRRRRSAVIDELRSGRF